MTNDSVTNEKKSLQPTMLVCGYTGSGKTSLIQGIFGNKTVPDETIGHGTPMTQNFVKYRNDFIDIWDSRGFEASDNEQVFLEKQLEHITMLQHENDPENQIHIVWYAIQASGARVTIADINVIAFMLKKVKNAIVVITKTDKSSQKQVEAITQALLDEGIDRDNICPVFVYQQDETEDDEDDLDYIDDIDDVETIRKKIIRLREAVREVRHKLEEINDVDDSDNIDEVNDVDQLIQKRRELRQKLKKLKKKEKSRKLLLQLLDRTRTLMPKAYREAFMNAQMLELETKKAKAQAVIHSSAVLASALALDPIPLKDSVVITTIQLTMIASLAAVYGLVKETVKVAASPLLAQVVGPVAVTSLLKFLPGLGSVAQFVVAGTLTEAVGQAVNAYLIKCCHALINNEPTPNFILADYQDFFKNLGNSEQ